MNATEAQRFVILGNLFTVTVILAFFALAPAFGFPLRYDQTARFIQVLVPVFAGYLGLAAAFVFSAPSPSAAGEDKAVRHSRPLLMGAWGVLLVVFASAILAFGYSNRASAAPGSGMSVDSLAQFLVAALAVFTAVAGAAVPRLFRRD